MKDFKLTIELLPKGAWNNDLSKTLAKKDWDTLRNFCYKKANHKCEICGYQTDDLDAHEVWEFDVDKKTQTLKNIIAICSKCHGVKHFKNSVRLGYGDKAKSHFLSINNCSEMEFANHLFESVLNYEKQNKIFRWKMIANLNNFGGKNISLKENIIPMIINPYENVSWDKATFSEMKSIFTILKKEKNNFIGTPKITSIIVDNYQGTISVNALSTNKIEWILDDKKIKTKYNVSGNFCTQFSVKDLTGKSLHFKLINGNGCVISKDFILR